MSDDLRITVIKLANDGLNWVTFQDHMTWAFGSRQWAAHLISTMAPIGYDAALWQREEASAINLITASVLDHVFNCIKTKTSALEVWNTVKVIYQTRSEMIIVDLGKKLQGTKLGDDEDACIHLTILLDLREQLAVAQHKAQHTGDVSHLCSKEKTLGVEVLCVCTSEDERRGCVFTTLPIGGFIYSMTHPCPFA